MSRELYYPGDIVGFYGFLRQGKTMGMVRASKLMFDIGYPVISNIKTSFGRQASYIEDIYEARDHVVDLDEMWALADSRLFKNNVTFTQNLILFGKRGQPLFYTAPSIDMVDKRLRQLTNWIYFARKLRPGLSSIKRFAASPNGRLRSAGSWRMVHSEWGQYYDTLSEQIFLPSRSEAGEPAQQGSQPGAARASPKGGRAAARGSSPGDFLEL